MSPERSSIDCGGTPVSETQYGGTTRPSDAVVDALAEAEGISPLDLDPLYDAIDPDAVDRIFGYRNEAIHRTTVLEFTVGDWRVFVGDGRALVCEPDEDARTSTGAVDA